jgi:NADH:ubiquinone oxidoreductase subunit 2 (subunit N)
MGGGVRLPDATTNGLPLLAAARFEGASVNSEGLTPTFWWQNETTITPQAADGVLGLLPSLLTAVHPLTAGTVMALLLLLVNLLFKLTAAPFQFWAPSVYGKAPLPAVTIRATSSKIRVIALLLKLLPTLLAPFPALTVPLLLAAGIGSVTAGRVGALSEPLLKRFFVFSSRGHVGFRLVGVSLGTAAGAIAAVHYAFIYAFSALLGWFLLLTLGRRRTHLVHLTRLARTEPILAYRRAILSFSRAGLPPLGGFYVKLDLLTSLIESGNRALAYVLFILTVISFFYYLRLIKVLFFDQSTAEQGLDANPALTVDRPRDERRLFLRIAISLRLVFYLFIVQSSLRAVRGGRLNALHLLRYLSP